MGENSWIAPTVSLILFLFSVINGLAFLINKKDSEKQSELMKCIVSENVALKSEINNLKKENGTEHKELFDARREAEKKISVLETKVENIQEEQG